jgi:hypothetical protein
MNHKASNRRRRWYARGSLVQVLFAIILTLPLVTFAKDDLIQSLAGRLRQKGIHTRTQWTAGNTAVNRKPTLSPLEGFPADTSLINNQTWLHDLFTTGVFHDSALLAIEADPHVRRSTADEFKRRWNESPKTQRVFISFTRNDNHAAQIIKSELESQGYECFTYLRGDETWTNVVEVGHFFNEAGVHLVIDSAAARRSGGVQLEALVKNGLISGTSKPLEKRVDCADLLAPHKVGEECCQLCYYEGDKLVNCVSMGCGPQCAGLGP